MDGENEKRQCNFNCVMCTASSKLSEAEWKAVGKILSRATRTALKPLDNGKYTENKENNILSLQPEDMLSF